MQFLFPLVILFCVHCNYLRPLLHLLHSILSFFYSLLLLSYLLDLKQYRFGSQFVFLFQQSLFIPFCSLIILSLSFGFNFFSKFLHRVNPQNCILGVMFSSRLDSFSDLYISFLLSFPLDLCTWVFG